jgi:hypothetical protein
MNLIAFTGQAGSGKDTAASVFVENGYVHLKMADGLKEMLRRLLGLQGIDAATVERMIDGDLKEDSHPALGGRSPRYAMQTLGTGWGRDLMSETFWVDAAERRIKRFSRVVISDVRFPNEVGMIRRLGGKVYRVERLYLGSAQDHVSESHVATLPVHAVLFNAAPSADEFRRYVMSVLL